MYTLDPSVRALLSDLGVSAGRVLRRAGLPADLLADEPVGLPTEQYFALWDALEEEYDGPELPVAIAGALSVEVFQPPIFAALCSANLEVAARRIATYKKLIGPLRLEVDDTADHQTTLVLHWPVPPAPPQSLAATELLFWVALARIATRSRVRPLAVTMPDPPPDAGVYRDFLGVAVQAGAAHAVTFAELDAARPFLTENAGMWQRFEPSLRARLFELEAGSAMSERVRGVLLEKLPAGEASVQGVARALAVSPRTLQRRLGAEGTSYQAVLDRVREDLARHYLADARMGVGTIAFLLGYQDQSSFYRAFSSWTGQTPERARRRAV
jgi:AraC-like DNA-binding protein